MPAIILSLKTLPVFIILLASALLVSALFVCLNVTTAVNGLTVQPPLPGSSASPLRITGYRISQRGVELVQIYNSKSELVQLEDYLLDTCVSMPAAEQASGDIKVSLQLSGHLKPNSYVVVARTSSVELIDITIPIGADQVVAASSL